MEQVVAAQISIQEAVTRAKAWLRELYFDDPPRELALEEIELRDDEGKKVWSVTLGFHRPKKVSEISSSSLGYIFRQQPQQVEHRVYKTVLIDASTGDFVRMDMRQVG